MSKKSTVSKLSQKQKFNSREVNYCTFCGRTRAYMRQFGMCRICFREKASRGEIPGVKKSSW